EEAVINMHGSRSTRQLIERGLSSAAPLLSSATVNPGAILGGRRPVIRSVSVRVCRSRGWGSSLASVGAQITFANELKKFVRIRLTDANIPKLRPVYRGSQQ